MFQLISDLTNLDTSILFDFEMAVTLSWLLKFQAIIPSR